MNENKIIMGIISALIAIIGYYDINSMWTLIFGFGIAFIITGLIEDK